MYKEITQRIAEIEQLLSHDTYKDYLAAIDLMKNNYEWHYSENETFYATLLDYDIARAKYEQKYINKIVEARLLFTTLFSTIPTNEQVEKVKKEIEAALKNNTFNDAKAAIYLLNKKYSWKTENGSEFEATLSNYNNEIERLRKKEKYAEDAEIEWNKRKEELEQEYQKNVTKKEKKKKIWKWVKIIIIGYVVIWIFSWIATHI